MGMGIGHRFANINIAKNSIFDIYRTIDKDSDLIPTYKTLRLKYVGYGT